MEEALTQLGIFVLSSYTENFPMARFAERFTAEANAAATLSLHERLLAARP